MLNTAKARINLAALRHNLDVARKLCPHSRIMAMVKADAYGHGLYQTARCLSSADGFAVARLQEALALRESDITQRILLLATLLSPEDLQQCSKLNIDVTAHDQLSVNMISEQARSVPLRVWLKLDSGMHRAGLSPLAFIQADRMLVAHPGIRELTHMTHFSDALDIHATDRQLVCLSECRAATSRAPLSVANSAALITRPATRTDWVRPGIMLYGVNPAAATHPVALCGAMELTSRVVAIRDVEIAETVGYSGRWVATRRSRIGTVGIGYGDGYPRHAANGTPILVDQCSTSIVGQISMDSLTADLTELPQISVGDEAILWGHELPAAVIAGHAGTISYELFTSVSSRVSREYVG